MSHDSQDHRLEKSHEPRDAPCSERYRTWYQSARRKYSPRVALRRRRPQAPPPPSAPRAAILPPSCLATVRALPRPAFASRRAVAGSLRRRRIPAVVLPGGPCKPRAPSLRRRRISATPSSSSAVAILQWSCLAVALPGHREHPTESAVASRAPSFVVPTNVALQRPGLSCPACYLPILLSSCPACSSPAVALPPPLPCCLAQPATVVNISPRRRPACNILLLPCPAGALLTSSG